MRLVRNRGGFLSGIGDADGRNIQLVQGAVVKAAAIAQPVPLRVECEQRHQQQVRRHARPMLQRLVNAIGTGRQHFAVRHAVEFQWPALGSDTRERNVTAQIHQTFEQRCRIGLFRQRMIGADNHAFADRQGLGTARNLSREPGMSQRPAPFACRLPKFGFGEGGRYHTCRWYWISMGLQVQVGVVCPEPRLQPGTTPDEYN